MYISDTLSGMGTVLISCSVFYLIKTASDAFTLWLNRHKLDEKTALEKRISQLEAQVNTLTVGRSYDRL